MSLLPLSTAEQPLRLTFTPGCVSRLVLLPTIVPSLQLFLPVLLLRFLASKQQRTTHCVNLPSLRLSRSGSDKSFALHAGAEGVSGTGGASTFSGM